MNSQVDVASQATSRRAEALVLADELLGDIELSRISSTAIVRKASRLARLMDDDSALEWLSFELHGYLPDEGNALGPRPWAAAVKSNRIQRDSKTAAFTANTTMVGELEASIEAAREEIGASTDPAISLSSSNPSQFVSAPIGNARERLGASQRIGRARSILDRVMGAVHAYVSETFQALRFGSAVESAFDVVRTEVDRSIGRLIPDALPTLSAAIENLSSPNPEHWAQAAASCRRLVKAAADALRPPGDDKDGRKMDDAHYINRLIDWIQEVSTSETMADSVSSDLEYLGGRLDAANDAGHKGAHAGVTREDAARFITGTYLLLGDVLRLQPREQDNASSSLPLDPPVGAGQSVSGADEALSEAHTTTDQPE